MRERNLLSNQQRKAVNFIKSTPNCALWADMGTGKTISTLTALTDLFNQFDIGRVLVIAPLRVILHTWGQEISQWAHTQGLSHTIIRGTADKRRQLTQANTDIHLINRELVVDLVNSLGKKWHYDTVVIDESSSFKNPSSKRFRALKKALPYINRVIELTGTPASNGLLNLWSQIYLLDTGTRLGRTFTQYKQRHFEADYMGYNWTVRDNHEDKIHDAVSDIVLRLEYPHRSEPNYNNVTVNLPTKAQQQYRQLEKEFLLQLEDDTIEVLSAAALSGKLMQCVNGAIYTNEHKEWSEIHQEKLNALDEIVNETSSPILIAYNFRHDLARLQKKYPQAQTLDSDDAVNQWNKGNIPLLLAHPASAGHGLNLQYGGHTIVWFGLNWSLELYQQFNARLHRQGQTKQVTIHHIVAENSIDETILKTLAGKHITQQNLLDALKTDIELNLEREK